LRGLELEFPTRGEGIFLHSKKKNPTKSHITCFPLNLRDRWESHSAFDAEEKFISIALFLQREVY